MKPKHLLTKLLLRQCNNETPVWYACVDISCHSRMGGKKINERRSLCFRGRALTCKSKNFYLKIGIAVEKKHHL